MTTNPMLRLPVLLLLSVLVVLTGAAIGAPQQADPNERETIERERVRVEAAYSQQQRHCQERFAVNSCVDQAKRTRRAALAELKRRTIALDDAQRRQRAERRRQDIRDKVARTEAAAREPRPPRQAGEM
ncbi:MAG: hypothetical protein WA210_15670, partial [Burkholderiaceae bacterium]